MDYGGDEDTWDAVEHTFLSVFCIEVGLRLMAFSWLFFTDAWNWIDFTVVVQPANNLLATMPSFLLTLNVDSADGRCRGLVYLSIRWWLRQQCIHGCSTDTDFQGDSSVWLL